MATYLFDQPSAEVENGTETSDVFIGSNNNFGAGDQAYGNGGIDDFQYFADSSLIGDASANVFGGATKTFAAFILNSVETFTTVNDSGRVLVFDFSSSSGITDLVVSNSTSGVVYDQVNSLANVRLVRQTNTATTNVAVGYAASLTAGADTGVNLVLDNTNGNTVRLGTATGTVGQPTNSGIETVRLTGIGGDSTIATLDTNLTNLIIEDSAGSFDITITNALNTTVRNITSQTDGDVTLSWANNGAGAGVTYTGSSTLSANTVTGGAGADTITTFGGDDVIDGRAGNDVINAGDGANRVLTGTGSNTVTTGSGRDIIYAQGTGLDTINSGLGDDVVNARANTDRLTFRGGDGSDLLIFDNLVSGDGLNASIGNDDLDFGANFDVMIIDDGETDAQFAQVRNLEGVAIVDNGTTTLGANAQAAGVNTVFLGSGTAGADTVIASAFTTGLTIQAASSDSSISDGALETVQGLQDRFNSYNNGGAGGGNDTVTTGSGSDYFLFRGDGALTNGDKLDANGSPVGTLDTLVLEGDTTASFTGANFGFRNFEFVALESAVGSLYRSQTGVIGNAYNLTLSNVNAPSSGLLFINGSNLKAAVAGVNSAETANINATAVTAFGLDITTGAANDVVQLGSVSSNVSTQGGNDTITDGAGNDVIDSGLGNDTVTLTAGDNTVFDAGGTNTITLGTGNDAIFVGGGNDTIIAGANLTGADTLVDGGGYDIVRIGGRNYTDADFAGVNTGAFTGFEELQVSGTFTYTLGANAQRAGFQFIRATDVGSSTINLASWTRAVTVDLDGVGADGNDVVVLGTAAAGTENLVLAGQGDQSVTGGTGTDVFRFQASELTVGDTFFAGAGIDRVELDNSTGTVNGTVSLTTFRDVERYVLTSGGDLGAGVDANANTLVFRDAALTAVNTLTKIDVDSRALTDGDDSFTVTLDASLLDPDFAFDVYGNAVATTLIKNNGGTNNNIFFIGGSGVDTFIANGSDFGATTAFDGNGGTDRILLNNNVPISDDGFVNVSEVEILGAVAGFSVNATLGGEASQAGIVRIEGTTLNDNVLFDPAFTTAVTVNLGNGGDDVINASLSSAVVTFQATAAELTALDKLFGGTTANDVLNITSTGNVSSDITGVTGVETVNFAMTGNGLAQQLTLDTQANEVNGGTQVINVTGGSATRDFDLFGGGASANLIVNAGGDFDDIRTGSGNDQVTVSGGGNNVNTGTGTDTITVAAGGPNLGTPNSLYGGLGGDTITGGEGVDFITGDDGASGAAGGGDDVLNGGGGADRIRGESGNDTIHGDAGNDVIYGGVGADVLWGDAGADTYLYAGLSDSSFNGRDTVHMDASDLFDFRDLAATGTSVAFKGSYASFEDAQSAVVAGDNVIDVVFNQASNRLWVDINDDGTLDGNDLQINIVFENGATNVTNANIIEGPVAPTPLTDFNNAFAAPFAP